MARIFLAMVFTLLVGCAIGEQTDPVGESSAALRPSCDLVRCALPLCAQGQHLAYTGGSCCPTCVGPDSRCAAVLCAAVACDEGEILVTSPGDCCGHCVAAPAAQECNSDDDCPQYYCIACPCPVSSCQGHRCVTETPPESSCGGAI